MSSGEHSVRQQREAWQATVPLPAIITPAVTYAEARDDAFAALPHFTCPTPRSVSTLVSSGTPWIPHHCAQHHRSGRSLAWIPILTGPPVPRSAAIRRSSRLPKECSRQGPAEACLKARAQEYCDPWAQDSGALLCQG